MSDFLCDMFAMAVMFLWVLNGIEYADTKAKNTRIFLLCLFATLFCVCNSCVLHFVRNQIYLTPVEKAWEEYTAFCEQEHFPWSEFTFPEWITVKASEGF